MSDADPADGPWYQDGLRFACTQCGNCCTGAGTVRVTDDEIARLAARLDMTDAAFRAVYTRTLRDGAISLREKSSSDCVFFQRGRGCSVYTDRPRQCRTWPFWRAVVHSPERWQEEAANCPGMNQGPRHPASQITPTAQSDGTR